MRVFKKSHPRVIHQYGALTRSDDISYAPNSNQNAIITDITKEETRNIGIEEDIFHYTVFFDCDLRVAMNLGIDSLDYRIYSKMPNTRYDFFQNYEGNPQSLMTTIYTCQKENAKRINNEIREATIKQGKISILDRVNSNLIRAQRKLSDYELFGRRFEIMIAKKDIKNKKRHPDSESHLPQIQLSTIDKSVLGNQENYASAYQSLISKGVDPSAAFVPVNNMISIMGDDGAMNGVNQKKNINTGVLNIDSDLNKLRSECESQNQLTDITSLSVRSRNTAKIFSLSNRYQTIPLSFKINSSEIKNDSNFIVQIILRDRNSGLIGQVLNINVDHKSTIRLSDIPEEIPNVSMASKMGSIVISCQSLDTNSKSTSRIQEIAVSHRVIDSFSKLQDTKFSRTIIDNNTYTLRANANLDSSVHIARVSPVLKDGRVLANFKSTAMVGKSFSITKLSINALSVTEGIRIFISNISYDIIGATILRRIVGEEQAFKTINYATDSSKSRELQENLNLFPDSFQQNSAYFIESGVLEVTDADVKLEKTYEYKIKIRRRHGADEIYSASAIEKFIPPSETIAVQSTLLKSELSGMYNGLEGPYKRKTVAYSISGTPFQTNTTKILQTILNSGLYDLFKGEIETFKASLSDSVIYSVTRYCFSTDESVFLGYFSKEFTDTTLWANRSYRYRVDAYLFNPREVSDSLQDGLKNLNVVKNTASLILPSTISKLKKAVVSNSNEISQITLADDVLAAERLKTMQMTFSSTKLSKNYSKISQTRGTIESIDKKSQEYNIEKYPTGDYAIAVVNKEKIKLSLSFSGRFSLTKAGYPLLEITQHGRQDKNYIDFLSITCLRQGKYSNVGPCDPNVALGYGSILFIDYLNKDYIGKIEYYATPVMIDGKIGKKVKICSGFLGKRIYRDQKKVKYSNSQGRIRRNG
tara:strand:+ start:62607 stop:65390 length:2784 start_codon:yes stop_codon:yes gene_type:complete